jgi:hypothetical protein
MANIIFPQSPFLDPMGRPAREWTQWLQNPNVQSLTAVTFNVDNVILTLPLEVIYGGTGLTAIPTNGQLLIGNGVGYTLNTLIAGTGLTVTNAAGSITTRITNTGVVAGVYGSSSSTTTLTVNAQGQLTVAGSVAIAISASQITSGTLGVIRGGTGLTNYVVGDIIYANGVTSLSTLTDVALGNALISGGVGAVPSYGKIGLTTHVSGILPVTNGGTGLAALTANRIPYGNGTAAYQSSANLTYDGSIFTVQADIVVNKTITASGTTGAQTINKTAGSVNFAIAATSLIVTNSLVTTSSVILATVASNDSTMKSVQAVAATGSFTLYANAAATAETRVNFLVIN